MKKEVDYLLARVATGKYSRRAFLGRAGAVGISSTLANFMLANSALAAGPKRGGVLRLGLAGGATTDSLDPALAAGFVPFNLTRQFGETLMKVSPTGDLVYRLAEAVESSQDATTWYFRIRGGVEFHNGKTLTPQDVVRTLERHSDKQSKSQAFGLMKSVSSINVDGPNVVVTLDGPNADFPYLMAERTLVIQPDGGFSDPAIGIGTGPYQIIEEQPGVRYMSEKFKNYWDEDSGFFEQVETYVMNDPTARNGALRTGQVHMINSVDPKIAKLLAQSPGVDVKNTPGGGHYVFPMMTNAAPFDNNDLRLALKYAVNREEMVKKVLLGYGSIGNDFPINASYPLFDDSIPQRDYDLEKAAFHYKKSGHDGTPIALHTSEVAFPGALDAAQLLQSSAKSAGIPINIVREPNDGYWSEVWNVKPFVASYWQGRPVQDQIYSTAYLSSAPYNDTRFSNSSFDTIIVQAKAELDPDKRKSLYREAAQIVRDEGGVICPMFNDYIDAVSSDIAGWEGSPNGQLMNGFAVAKCWFS